jgi:hypothetical protein
MPGDRGCRSGEFDVAEVKSVPFSFTFPTQM